MLRYTDGPLGLGTMSALKTLQDLVNAESTRSARASKATQLFKRKTPASAFAEVRARLTRLSPCGTDCFYCERDRHRDIEHIRPKKYYPELCFVWNNYVYACVICNQDEKRDKAAVVTEDETLVVFARQIDDATPLPAGIPALIDIRTEDPLDHIVLDLQTGYFVPSGVGVSALRADYTVKLFQLNEDNLARGRRRAVAGYVDYIEKLKTASAVGDAAQVATLESEIKLLPNPTVLVEMRRQSPFNAELAALFVDVPAWIGARPA